MTRTIRVGIGGWTYPPWRGVFYPPGLPHARELAHASRAVTSIEINGTFYGSQSPASFQRWAAETPDDFVFAVKGPRFATHRRDLAGAAESVTRFLDSGLLELGDKLGPILWQFPPTRVFDPAAMTPFLDALPERHGGRTLRHVIETYHSSFADRTWIALLRERGLALAIVESGKHHLLADVTADFVYARLERNDEATQEGYETAALDAWAERARKWSGGKPVTDLPRLGPVGRARARDCFLYFIGGDKHRAPDAAQAMLRRLSGM